MAPRVFTDPRGSWTAEERGDSLHLSYQLLSVFTSFFSLCTSAFLLLCACGYLTKAALSPESLTLQFLQTAQDNWCFSVSMSNSTQGQVSQAHGAGQRVQSHLPKAEQCAGRWMTERRVTVGWRDISEESSTHWSLNDPGQANLSLLASVSSFVKWGREDIW